MPQAQTTITIQKPVSEVFAFVLNHDNDPQWRPGVVEIRKTSGEGVGERWYQRVKGPGGREIPADIEITALEPNRVLAFRAVEGPVRPEGRYELAEENGSTRLSFSLSAELKGLKKLMSPMVQKQMNAEVGNLDNLKRVLES
jgi:uncharacterized protein YndB with AHSA1/START domain